MTARPSSRPLWRNPVFIITCGCLIAILSFGVRSSYGLFNAPLSETRGWGREVFALALALQNLLWGLGQPVAGALADKFGSVRVLAIGGIIYAAGVILSAYATTPLMLQVTAGMLVGMGLAGASFTIVIASFTRLVPEEKRSLALGAGTAAGSIGQFIFAPMGQAFIAGYGWETALVMLGACMLLVPLLATALGTGKDTPVSIEPEMTFTNALKQAFGHGSYIWLISGFFVCGFQVAFITVHLPAYLDDNHATAGIGAWAIALVGLFNVVGSLTAGALGGKFSKRWLLSGIYLGRSIVIALFVLAPKTDIVVLTFAASMGLLWLSTVPLTSGLVAVMFGTRYMGTLFGFVFFSHQIGSFLGVWLGGRLYDTTGSYDMVWWMSVALGLFAMVVHLPIREQRAPDLVPVIR
ncbi:MAG: MFS transporter [Rhodospirillales bacterium]